MLLKNGKAAEKIKMRRAATTHRSKIRACSFQPKNIFDSPDAIELGCKVRTSVRKQKAATTWAAAPKCFTGYTPAIILGRLVFHRAPVRFGLWCGDRFACQHRVNPRKLVFQSQAHFGDLPSMHRKNEEQEKTIAELKSGMTALAATVKEQASQIQKVSDQLEARNPAPQVVNNPKAAPA